MLDQAIERAKSGEVAVLDENEFRALLQDSMIVFQENTYISDMIRILERYGTVLVQEMTDEKQIIIRAMPTIEQVRTFVSRRLDTYERMWDTSGCKVSYFDT